MSRTLLLCLCLPVGLLAQSVAGDWSMHLLRLGEDFYQSRLHLTAESEGLTGTFRDNTVKGTITGDQIKLTAVDSKGKEIGTLEGRVSGDEITGIAKLEDEELGWRVRRLQLSDRPPKTHEFTPQSFHRLFSGTIEPVLRIAPGDTVRTTTVDAGGRDAKGVRRSMGGNPETGPFYVEGAFPGDTVAIRFRRIRLNRASAASGRAVVLPALDAGYARDAKFDKDFKGDWTLDLEGGFATLTKATERLRNVKLKVRPMLGCVAVAPPMKQAFRTGWLGSWGGNMDYSGVREGVTVYLPVFQEGALLFVGDGHALEGDGELTGDALETSMDVEFTVDLIRGKSSQAPRFEDDEYLMASGIEGSLQEALQQATTQLMKWLERDYKLSPNEASVLLGAAIKYDIAEIVDPQVHVVAKISKTVVNSLQ